MVDPYLTSSTIAAMCNITYRKIYLKKDAIGVVPILGYMSVSLFAFGGIFCQSLVGPFSIFVSLFCILRKILSVFLQSRPCICSR